MFLSMELVINSFAVSPWSKKTDIDFIFISDYSAYFKISCYSHLL